MREANEILISSHSRHVYNFGSKPYPSEQSPLTVTRAFGAQAPPKLIGQLKSPELLIRQKALLAAHELLSSKFSFEQCMACGITPPLATLLQDPDNLVRERAAKCMTVIGRKATGVRKILVCGALPTLLDLLQDAELAVRDAAYGCMSECCHHSAFQEAMVETKSALGTLLTMVQAEAPDRAEQGLTILLACALGGDYADNGVDQLIIDGEAMPVLKALIREGKTPGVREGAVRLLTRLCTTPEARQEAVGSGLVAAMLLCLTQGSLSLSTATVEAFMQITIAVQGKQAMVLSGQLPLLVELLEDAQPHLASCLVELICNCAELPAAKKELQAAIPLLQELADNSTNLRTQQSAVQAVQRLSRS
ncbi:hypothetical protein WJX82_001687 [Trebouxia sp. C0006]